MPIESVTVHNFKSYAGTQTLGPFKNFTGVIGPNGSGKSNVMDAISFVLGVKTAQLRGSQLKDLICHGEKEAYVEFSFMDDSSGTATTELTFRRCIKGDGVASYQVNGKKCTWKVYSSRLEEIGVVVKAGNFLVFQGDVESIAQKSPQELTQLFEEISGSGEHKQKYEDLSEKAQDAEALYLRAFERKKNLLKEKKQLRDEKEEAEKFQGMLTRKSQMWVKYFLWQLYHLGCDLEASTEQVELKRAALSELKNEVVSLEKSRAGNAQLVGKTRLARTKVNKQVTKLRNQLDIQQTGEINDQEKSTHLKCVLETLEKNRKKLSQESEAQKEVVGVLQQRLEAAEKDLEVFEETVEESQLADLNMSKQQLTRYERLKSDAGAKTATLRQEVDVLEHKLRAQNSVVADISSKFHAFEVQSASWNEPIENLLQKQRDTRQKIQETKKQLATVDSEFSATKAERVRVATRTEELTGKLEAVLTELGDVQADQHESNREIKLRECIVQLKRLYPGVRGRVSDLCKPSHPKFNAAVSVGLGRNFDAIVTDDQATAVECLQYVKQQKIGVCTFLPLDFIEVMPVKESFRNIGGSFKLLLDVIEYDQSIAKAMLYACGDALVCDTLDEARRLAYGSPDKAYKVVTVGGEVIHRNGNMTGGISGVQDRGNRWDQQHVSELKEHRDRFLNGIAELQRGADSREKELKLQYRVAELTEQLKHMHVELTSLTEDLNRCKATKASAEDSIASTGSILKKEQAVLDKITAKVDETKGRILDQQHDMFDEFSKEIGVANIEEYESNRRALSEEYSAKRVQLSVLITKLTTELEQQRTRDLAEPLGKLEEDIQKKREELEKVQSSMGKVESAVAGLTRKLDACTSELEAFDATILAAVQAMADTESLAKEKSNTLRDLEEEILAKESHVESIKTRRGDIIRQCTMEKIVLPSNSHDRMDVDEELDDSEQLAERERVMLEDLDFTLLGEQTPIESTSEYNDQLKELQAELENLTSELESIAPNLKAIDKFTDMSARLDASVEELEQAKEATREAERLFQECAGERRRLFMDAFNHVASEINDVYKNLTKSTRFPLGGTAYLNLLNIEKPFFDGIKFHAMPPMKRFRDMEQLSGGEKTVAALALLFAIHSFKPAPFFVLDEVDAALDSVNVHKVSNYIR